MANRPIKGEKDKQTIIFAYLIIQLFLPFIFIFTEISFPNDGGHNNHDLTEGIKIETTSTPEANPEDPHDYEIITWDYHYDVSYIEEVFTTTSNKAEMNLEKIKVPIALSTPKKFSNILTTMFIPVTTDKATVQNSLLYFTCHFIALNIL